MPTTNGLELVDMKDIVRCEADRNYTKIFFANGNKILISKNLKEVEDMMDNELFFRVHQSHLININCIKKYIKGEGGQILLTDNTYVDVSRRKKENLLELLTHKI
ncbi:MAG: LytTR family transcriptional regulator [Bacteroidetes bacterium]|nr:LytTR family transcriptional regulator [Bacteroidota bacterium]